MPYIGCREEQGVPCCAMESFFLSILELSKKGNTPWPFLLSTKSRCSSFCQKSLHCLNGIPSSPGSWLVVPRSRDSLQDRMRRLSYKSFPKQRRCVEMENGSGVCRFMQCPLAAVQ